MDIRLTALLMEPYIALSTAPDHHITIGKDHLHFMIHEIIEGGIDGDRAQRWLGYVQGICVAFDIPLDTIQLINSQTEL